MGWSIGSRGVDYVWGGEGEDGVGELFIVDWIEFSVC